MTLEFIIQSCNNAHGSNILIETLCPFKVETREFLALFRNSKQKKKKGIVDVLVYLRLRRMSAAAAAIIMTTAAAIAM